MVRVRNEVSSFTSRKIGYVTKLHRFFQCSTQHRIFGDDSLHINFGNIVNIVNSKKAISAALMESPPKYFFPLLVKFFSKRAKCVGMVSSSIFFNSASLASLFDAFFGYDTKRESNK